MKADSEKFARQLLRWYDRSRRDLPWRARARSRSGPNPYHALVSEMMLQQTQVCTVVPYFERFIERFPTFSALAAAKEQEVMRLWQGLGYYRRARHLHQAAKEVISRRKGILPRTVDELMMLPGIGRYTAGAIASIAFGERAPILDGNVARVLCRLDQIESDPRQPPTLKRLWKRAEQILPRRRCGDFNSALMELGATVCTPRNPACNSCPLRIHCRSRAAGAQDRIPIPKVARPLPLLRRDVLCLRRADGKYLIEQRPPTGRWAGMWQFITVDSDSESPLARRAGLRATSMGEIEPVSLIRHVLTHRRYEFQIHHAVARGHFPTMKPSRIWASLSELDEYPLPRVHQKVAAILSQRESGR